MRLAAAALVCALLLGACGSSSEKTIPTPTVTAAALSHPPVGCTHHLVFASHGSEEGRMIALSFDDGPSPYTRPLYETFLRYHVPATFFMIGERVAAAIERREGGLLREMIAHGMEIGNHSYDHPHDLPHEGEGTSLQLELANREIERASGFTPCLFRPPYGNQTSELVQRAKVLGLVTTRWDDSAEDWQHPGANVIAQRVLAAARPGAIVTLHDNTETEGQTAEAMPKIIEGLQARGYHLVTITQILGEEFIGKKPPRKPPSLSTPIGSTGE